MSEKKQKTNNKRENLKEELEETKKIAEERLNHLKYMQADFDNYRKKFEEEKQQIIQLANEELIKELIIILDDFEATINSMQENKDKEGIKLLGKKLKQTLEKNGLKPIETLGKQLNPHLHEVFCKEQSEKEEDEILQEIQKGYMFHSKVIRPSKVKVSKKN